MGAGLVAAHIVAPPEASFVGQSQIDVWVEQGGVGGVVVLLQVLLQQAVVRKLLLQETFSGSGVSRFRPGSVLVPFWSVDLQTHLSVCESSSAQTQVQAGLDPPDSHHSVLHGEHLHPAWRRRSKRRTREKKKKKNRFLVTARRRGHTWTQLTVIGGFVDAAHRAVRQDPEVEANPDAAVEQLLLGPFSDWTRSRTCFNKEMIGRFQRLPDLSGTFKS